MLSLFDVTKIRRVVVFAISDERFFENIFYTNLTP